MSEAIREVESAIMRNYKVMQKSVARLMAHQHASEKDVRAAQTLLLQTAKAIAEWKGIDDVR
jgi:hypothetical protein